MDILDKILKELELRHCFEFARDGKAYLIQPDGNKGCHYLSLWQTGSAPVQVCHALYDIFDGIERETVAELLDRSGLKIGDIRSAQDIPYPDRRDSACRQGNGHGILSE